MYITQAQFLQEFYISLFSFALIFTAMDLFSGFSVILNLDSLKKPAFCCPRIHCQLHMYSFEAVPEHMNTGFPDRGNVLVDLHLMLICSYDRSS